MLAVDVGSERLLQSRWVGMSWVKLVVNVGTVVVDANVTAICNVAVSLSKILLGSARYWCPWYLLRMCRECRYYWWWVRCAEALATGALC